VEPFTLSADNGLSTPGTANEMRTYQNEDAGFRFDYPATWTVDGEQQAGSRGSVIQLTSWEHAPGDIAAETPPGGTRLDVVLLDWDPKHDLAAHIAVREQAWAASGMTITAEEARLLAGDHPAVRFLVTSPGSAEPGFFLITTVGDRYLHLSGFGDLAALEAIGQTLQIGAEGSE